MDFNLEVKQRITKCDSTDWDFPASLEQTNYEGPNPTAERFLESLRESGKLPSIHCLGDELVAAYSFDRHHIRITKRELFLSSRDYYRGLFHELVHSTGRHFGRDMRINFFDKLLGSRHLTVEELTAELGAELIIRKLGFPPCDKWVNYCKGWISTYDPEDVLNEALENATKAVNYLLEAEQCD